MAIKRLCILPVFSSFSLLSFTPKLMASVKEGKYFLKAALPVIFSSDFYNYPKVYRKTCIVSIFYKKIFCTVYSNYNCVIAFV